MTITRRQVATGAAWTLPALTVAAAAPSLATSCDPASNTSILLLGYSMERKSDVLDVPGDASGASQRTIFTLTNHGPAVAPRGARITVRVTATVPTGFDLTVRSDMTSDVVQGGTAQAPVYTLTYTLPADLAPGSVFAYDVETIVDDHGNEGFYAANFSSAPTDQQRLVRQCDTAVLDWNQED